MEIDDPDEVAGDHSKSYVGESDEEIIAPSGTQTSGVGKRKALSPICSSKSAKAIFRPTNKEFSSANTINTEVSNQNDPFHGFEYSNTEESGNIIVVKPQPDSNNLNIRNFFKNDISLASNLDKTISAKIGIKNVRKNLNKEMLIIELKTNIDKKSLIEIMNLDKIGSWKVDCRLPENRQLTHGVIGPIDLETPLDDLQAYLKQKNHDIIGIKRLFKGKLKERNLSQCIKISFNLATLPEYIYIGYQRYKVRLFIDSPWQCFNCQRFGHNAINCRSNPRCLLCGDKHKLYECPGKNQDNYETKCTNCNGSHAANYGGCPKIKEAKQIEKIRAEKKLSYSAAVKSLTEGVVQSNVAPNTRSNIPKSTTQLNASRILANPITDRTSRQVKKAETKEVAIQTKTVEPEMPQKTMIENFMKIMINLIKTKNKKNLENQCSKLIYEAFNLEVDLGEADSSTEEQEAISRSDPEPNSGQSNLSLEISNKNISISKALKGMGKNLKR